MANTLKFGNGVWATKKGSTLAYNDENGNFKPLPFTTTRSTSATRVNKEGLIEVVSNEVPRIDFKDNTKGALLLEPTRSNLVTYSEDFSQFTGGGSIVIESGYLAPDGTNSAYKVSGSGGALNISLSLTNSETRSIYAKTISGQGNAHLCSYFGNTNNLKTITEDWQRFEVNGTTTETGVTSFYAVDFRGSTDLNEIIIWGAQAEQGSYATSYIPTSGQSGGVTRVGDSSSQTVPDGVIEQTEGTVFAEVNVSSIESVGVYSGWKIDGTSGNKISFIIYPTGRIQATVFDGGSLVVNINDNNYGLTSGIHKIALAYRQNDYILYVNGSVVGSDTSATVPIVNYFDISHLNGGSLKYNETKLYNTRLSNAELQALTS